MGKIMEEASNKDVMEFQRFGNYDEKKLLKKC